MFRNGISKRLSILSRELLDTFSSISSELRLYDVRNSEVFSEVIHRFRRFLLVLDVEVPEEVMSDLFLDTFHAVASKLLQSNVKDPWVYAEVIYRLRRLAVFFNVDKQLDLWSIGEKIVFEEAEKLGVSLPEGFTTKPTKLSRLWCYEDRPFQNL